jgi:hypothetical protein
VTPGLTGIVGSLAGIDACLIENGGRLVRRDGASAEKRVASPASPLRRRGRHLASRSAPPASSASVERDGDRDPRSPERAGLVVMTIRLVEEAIRLVRLAIRLVGIAIRFTGRAARLHRGVGA